MTLFTNSNFIHHIVHSQGLEHNFDKKEHFPTLQTLIELETRQLLETAIKFMHRDRRDILTTEDLECALQQLNHSELAITPHGDHSNKDQLIVKEDKTIPSPAALMEEQLQLLGTRQLEGPRMSGRWIYLKGKVPATTDNINIKRLEQLKQSGQHQQQQKRKLCNIIKDEPYSFLTTEQSSYFFQITKIISTDSAPQGIPIEGDLTNLLPFILQFLVANELNQTAMSFLLKLLENKYIWKAVEYGTVKSLNLLLAYKGPQSFKVGQKIAEIVEGLEQKYTHMRDIYVNYNDQSYSTVLKKIPFEMIVGVPFQISEAFLERCNEDAKENDLMAILCLKALLEYSSRLSVFKKLLARRKNTFIYWELTPEIKQDRFLSMF